MCAWTFFTGKDAQSEKLGDHWSSGYDNTEPLTARFAGGSLSEPFVVVLMVSWN